MRPKVTIDLLGPNKDASVLVLKASNALSEKGEHGIATSLLENANEIFTIGGSYKDIIELVCKYVDLYEEGREVKPEDFD